MPPAAQPHARQRPLGSPRDPIYHTAFQSVRREFEAERAYVKTTHPTTETARNTKNNLAGEDAMAQREDTPPPPPPPAPPDPLQAVWIRAAAGLGAAMAADDVGRETLAPYVRKARTSAGEGRGAGGRAISRQELCRGRCWLLCCCLG
jgi:hypothetical protein